MNIKRTLKDLWRLIYPVIIYFAVAFIVQFAAVRVIASAAVANGTITAAGKSTAELQEELNSLINRYSLHLTALTNVVLIPIYILLLRRDEKKRRFLSGRLSRLKMRMKEGYLWKIRGSRWNICGSP